MAFRVGHVFRENGFCATNVLQDSPRNLKRQNRKMMFKVAPVRGEYWLKGGGVSMYISHGVNKCVSMYIIYGVNGSIMDTIDCVDS